jgi:hypothetical protein
MRGLGLENSFNTWSKWTWTKKQRERRDVRKRFKMAVKAFDAAMEGVNNAQGQVSSSL